MTDSTDTTTAAERFAASMQMAAEARQQQADEAERHRQLMEGELLVRIDELNLNPEQLVAVADFIARGCIVVTDATLTQQVTDQQQEIVRLNAANESLQQQVTNLGGNHTIAFADEAERNTAEEILGHCKNGNGKFIDPNRVKNALKPRQQTARQQQGATSPPTQPTPATPTADPSDPGDPQPSKAKAAAKKAGSWLTGK